MGQELSQPHLANYSQYADTLLTSNYWEGFQVDSSLQRFSSLNSTEELNYYRDQVLYGDDISNIGSTVRKLDTALGGLTIVPNAVGLGALVIAMILDAIAKSLNKETLGTNEMLERVFAKENTNEIRELMEEYLKRLQINLGNQTLQLAETQQKEAALSSHLTRLKNSMMMDGQMHTRFLKQWVNGAAFHTLMLIHQARLEGTLGSRALRAATLYNQQLHLLLDEYKKYLKTVIHVTPDVHHAKCGKVNAPLDGSYCGILFTEQSILPRPCLAIRDDWIHCQHYIKVEGVVEAMFCKPQFTWAKTYFSDLQANIPTLVHQNGPFQL
ncbi:uncharacterized protein LOC114481191 [Gouania willdenowi]|uniref:uncharacterized protein LOC114481191 n=1 Tax=Gouania willdenowi TaxID=441366 RepID=UPI0010560E8A|nr:uncharacterized protein LOC114481191 [Gouania willdenowi]